jgi:GT2 family glycosyltransferase
MTWIAAAVHRRAVLWNRRRLHRRVMSRMPRYEDWTARHDTPDAAQLQYLHDRVAALGDWPEVDLFCPGPHEDAGEAHSQWEAAAAQIAPRWRLWVAAAAGDDRGALEVWRDVAARDPRVRLLETPADVAGRRRALLDAGRAPWCAVLDAHVRWRAHALALLLEAAQVFPEALAVYADEDRIDATGRRHEPLFKPDFDPELLLAQDALGHPVLWRRERLRAAAPERAASPGAWRHAIALAATADLGDHQVVHVPHVLAHRAPGARSAADEVADAPTVHAEVVRRHLASAGAVVEAEGAGVRVRYPLPDPPPWVTLIVPTRNGLQLLRKGLGSILARSTYPSFDLMVVDNGSDDPACMRWLAALAASDARVSVLRDDRPFNFSTLNNLAVERARGEFVALVNNDIEVMTPGWLEEMVSLAARPGVGAVGARLWYSDRTLQHGGVIIGIGEGAAHAHKRLRRHEPGMGGRTGCTRAFSAVTAACLVVRRSAYLSVGGLDEEHFPVAFNDVDFCLRLRAAGLRNLWTPHAELYHHESVSRGRDRDGMRKQRFLRERDALQRRWAPWLAWDPAYNPNLTLDHENFALADPPRVSLDERWFERRPWRRDAPAGRPAIDDRVPAGPDP